MYKKASVFLFMIILLAACTERIDVDIAPGYTRLVVEGNITTDAMHHCVKLSKSGDYLIDQSTPKVNFATVFVVSDRDTFYYEPQAEDGLYASQNAFKGIPGKSYQLHIENLDIDEDGIAETYQAESMMPNPMVIDSITLGYNVRIEVWFINLWATDPPEDNWYIFKSGINGVILRDTITEWQLQNDDLVLNGKTAGMFAQTIGAGNSQNADINDTILLELASVEQAYFQFSNNLRSESFGSNPLFGGPPANVLGNISNGALGYFSTQAITRSTTVVRSIPTVTNTPYGPR